MRIRYFALGFLIFAVIGPGFSRRACFAAPVVLDEDSGPESPRGVWSAAEFRGLRLGSARASDVLAVLGAPDRVENYPSETTGGSPVDWLIYESDLHPRLSGRTTASVDKGRDRVTLIEVLLRRSIERNDLNRVLGESGVIRRYAFCEGMGDLEAGPLVTDDSGDLAFVEYATLGIVASTDYRGLVQSVEFRERPIETVTVADCAAASSAVSR